MNKGRSEATGDRLNRIPAGTEISSGESQLLHCLRPRLVGQGGTDRQCFSATFDQIHETQLRPLGKPPELRRRDSDYLAVHLLPGAHALPILGMGQ